jgi:hypothetical protein
MLTARLFVNRRCCRRRVSNPLRQSVMHTRIAPVVPHVSRILANAQKKKPCTQPAARHTIVLISLRRLQHHGRSNNAVEL